MHSTSTNGCIITVHALLLQFRAKVQKKNDKCKYITYILLKFSLRKDNLTISPVILSAEMMLLLVFLSSFSLFFLQHMSMRNLLCNVL